MGLLDLSPAKVKVVRDVLVITIIGYFFVIGLAYNLLSLQQASSWIFR